VRSIEQDLDSQVFAVLRGRKLGCRIQ